MASFVNTPLWPAGHLPHKGRDHQWQDLRPTTFSGAAGAKAMVLVGAKRCGRLISLLVGEMPGRAEVGSQDLGADEGLTLQQGSST
jgi:hypothetical protein